MARELRNPRGKNVEITGSFTDFCKKKGLSKGSMMQVYNKQLDQYKGWRRTRESIQKDKDEHSLFCNFMGVKNLMK